MIDTNPIKPPLTLIFFFSSPFFFLNHTFCFTLTLIFFHPLASPFSFLKIFMFYLLFFFSQLSFLTQFISSLISLPSTQFISLKKILYSPICSYGFFLDVLARTYVIHLLGIYVTILCYWLIF